MAIAPAVDIPGGATRTQVDPEDCIVVADPTSPPLPLAASRLASVDGAWRVDPAVPVDAAWHGASVVSRGDGRLVGVLLVDEEEIRVALVPGGLLSAE